MDEQLQCEPYCQCKEIIPIVTTLFAQQQDTWVD